MNSILRVIVVCSGALSLLLSANSTLEAHPESETVRIATPVGRLAGTLLMVHADDPVPVCVLVGGDDSDDRQGGCARAGAPPRDALARWAEALAAGGYASLRYDPPRRAAAAGEVDAGVERRESYTNEARALAGAVEFLRRDARFDRVVLVGEGEGGYVVCLALAGGLKVDACLFLSPSVESTRDAFLSDAARLTAGSTDDASLRTWAERHARRDLAIGRRRTELLQALEANDATFALVDGEFRETLDLTRWRERFRTPPSDAFRTATAPTLALFGEFDERASEESVDRAMRALRGAGRDREQSAPGAPVERKRIAGVDRNFQRAPLDPALRRRERSDLSSFRRPYDARAFHAAIDWLEKTLPTAGEGYPEQIEQAASRATPAPVGRGAPPLEPRAVDGAEVDATTPNSPRRVRLAPGVEIVPDAGDRAETAGVETLEGRIGPLLNGAELRAHFVELPSGAYVEERRNAGELLVYTVRGRWVLCSRERRQELKPGSLFRAAADSTTGFEVPFDSPALLLVVQARPADQDDAPIMRRLQSLQKRLERDRQAGQPFLLSELEADHPARRFARTVNPSFAESLEARPTAPAPAPAP